MGPEEITTGLGLLGDKPTFADGEISALWPVTGDDERRALLEVLESGRWCRLKDEDWRTGEAGLFEEEFRDYLGAETFLAVSNGTLAIELGLLALGIGEGDEVIVQAATYFGTVTPILRVGATPVFVDVDPRTYTIDPDGVEAAITPRTRAVFAVHLAGQPADLDRLSAICQEHSLALLEDCAQAVGTDWRGRRVGTFGDIATFSFQQDKPLQSGEGGGVAARGAELAGRVYAFHQGFAMPGSPPTAKHEVATNLRISPWQAAVLRCQLRRLETQIEHRLANVSRLTELLEADDPVVPVPLHDATTRWSPYSLPFRYIPENAGDVPRQTFLEALAAEGLPAFEGHMEPLYQRPIWLDNQIRYRNEGCPVSERVSTDEYVAVMQQFLLGPPAWMERLVQAFRRIQTNAPRLAKLDRTG
ncbi:MAG: hypothetical protein QOJ97_194 [Solirubrobacteraceae bacterium]|jgi:dTDP-4-amino-4,6-dideoxygalactose transaminase|nr:hypothetical protein [Solirubrobacteraceae bacterium]